MQLQWDFFSFEQFGICSCVAVCQCTQKKPVIRCEVKCHKHHSASQLEPANPKEFPIYVIIAKLQLPDHISECCVKTTGKTKGHCHLVYHKLNYEAHFCSAIRKSKTSFTRGTTAKGQSRELIDAFPQGEGLHSKLGS